MIKTSEWTVTQSRWGIHKEPYIERLQTARNITSSDWLVDWLLIIGSFVADVIPGSWNITAQIWLYKLQYLCTKLIVNEILIDGPAMIIINLPENISIDCDSIIFMW